MRLEAIKREAGEAKLENQIKKGDRNEGEGKIEMKNGVRKKSSSV